MKINSKKCVACGNCTYVCPMGAIYIDPVMRRATINRNECVECYACFNGLSQEHLNPTFVRTVRGSCSRWRGCGSIRSRMCVRRRRSSRKTWNGRGWCGGRFRFAGAA